VSREIGIVQGGAWVWAVVHDCGTVCLYRQRPNTPYLLTEPWCPTCGVAVPHPEARIVPPGGAA
jgi:hypothetical protein